MQDVLMTEMADTTIELIDEEGIVIEYPVIVAFTVKTNYYTAVYDEKNDEIVIFKVLLDENGKEFIQVITDENEWREVWDCWQLIIAKTKNTIESKSKGGPF